MTQVWNLREIERLAHKLPRRLPASPDSLTEQLRLFADGSISIYYAPLGYVNPNAKLAIVGITPGWQQVQIAYQVAIDLIAGGLSPVEAHRQHKSGVAFAGSMRRNLITMLDEIGVNTHLGVESSSELFGSPLLHVTSALRFPVFKSGKNYCGHGPLPTKHAVLAAMLKQILAPELASISDALIVPLGKATSLSLSHLSSAGLISSTRCLAGFPHPSGANGHRRREFEAAKASLRNQVASWFSRRSLQP